MRIFFASDLHGSDRCFRKFLNAATFYKADWLVMGGDAAGKHLVPLLEEGTGWRGNFQGARLEASTVQELSVLKAQLADLGAYALPTNAEFIQALSADPALVETTLHQLIVKRAQDWVQLASERLDDSTRCVIGLGNDDYDDLAAIFAQGPTLCPPDGLIEMDGFWFGTLGWSNITPWRTHREKSEDDLAGLMAALESPDASRTIWNIHVPPYGSTLDVAPRLSSELQVELVGGAPDFIPVGSTAVADRDSLIPAAADDAWPHP